MANRTLILTEELYDYLIAHSLREPDILRRLREETGKHPMKECQIAPEQGQFMALLIQLTGAKKVLEVGVFTGYSSLVVALALPEAGKLVACDISEEYTSVARRYWREAGVTDKIELRIAPAQETLNGLMNEGHAGTFDFVFIDADKELYDVYYEQSLELVRSGGLIVFDNMLRGGRVVDSTEDDISVQSIRDLNTKLHNDDRIDLSLLPLGDGLTLARKR